MADSFIPTLAQTRLLKLARIRRERLLPVRGEVVVSMGGRVGSLDIVARADIGRLRPVPLARYLRATEAALPKYMLKKTGDPVEEREIVASKPELFGTLRRIYRAPGAGRIGALQGAWLTIELMETPFELKALYRGTVLNVTPRLGVVIEATGALVQGVWGAGGEGYGVLKKVVDAPDGVLTVDKVDITTRGLVLLAGAGATEDAMRAAAQEHAAGVIVGGLAPHLRQVAQELKLPTIVTDGLGEQAMSAPIFELLASHDGEETVVNTFAGARNARPEVFIPILAAGNTVTPPPTLVAEVGTQVRILSGSYLGQMGKIHLVPTMPHTLESGISSWGAEIEFADGDHQFVPWENLELIG